MKRLICILGCLVSGSHIYAMEGAVYGGLAPAFVGLYYIAGSSDSIGSKVIRLACATTTGAMIGGLSQLFLCTLQRHHASVIATTTAAIGCGFAQIWLLSKTISNQT